MSRIRVSEIFESVQGEGPKTGIPTTFLRVAGLTYRICCVRAKAKGLKRCPFCGRRIVRTNT